jgi:transposase
VGGAAGKAAGITPEQMELARLRAEVARLRMERDIAKKAAAYFAQDTLRGTPGFTK